MTAGNFVDRDFNLVLLLRNSILINGVTFDDILLQNGGRPLSECRCFSGIDTIADRDDCIQVIELYLPDNPPIAFQSNLFHFGTSCHLD